MKINSKNILLRVAREIRRDVEDARAALMRLPPGEHRHDVERRIARSKLADRLERMSARRQGDRLQ